MTDQQAAPAKGGDEMEGWEVTPDGRSVTRSFSVTTPRDAARFASRIVAISCKRGLPIDIHCNGTTVQIGLPRTGGFGDPKKYMDREQRRMAQRMDRLLSRPPKARDDKDEDDAS